MKNQRLNFALLTIRQVMTYKNYTLP